MFLKEAYVNTSVYTIILAKTDRTLKGMFSNSEKNTLKILTSYHFQFWYFSFIEVYLNSTKDEFLS